MVSTVAEVFARMISINIYGPLLTAVSVLVVIILLSLLMLKEFIRTADRPNTKKWMVALDITIAPLLLVFGVIVLLRFFL